MREFLSKVDLTLLEASATPDDFTAMAGIACETGCRAVCVPMIGIYPSSLAIKKWSSGNPMRPHRVKVCVVIDFPDGNLTTMSRIWLVNNAGFSGAGECDIVMPMGRFLSNKLESLEFEFRRLMEEAGDRGVVLKLIAETGYLSDSQIIRSAEFASKYNFMWKTSTGRDPKVQIPEKARHVRLVREAFPKLKIKAAGGIRTREDVEMLFDAGADILGVSWKSAIQIADNW
ncbi:MAG: hypothetical protein A2827_03235 [Candidatus Spechtbacteria bacterium RIFCSPHIGHO2_01_FULL_43_30]|uniref:Uncharacterized protein n=1 Tax=Candidatus Spechtbacteria bacterium RIFCSPHIGHO2_01_FULL_43_30 TaxID=1802158 RepID=A0A1G2H8Q3_9BACT|nr:MAG: hypothetical protein A2827_03235 [Candidatus Spechtbacteria bacterium RIFCSPHIGHO2_01_FULL_43_30]